ncbi:MAG: hypothetical protein KJ950_07250 [Proteobacteria bacterium]|nr:hypothetical protein [Pseudomonadota bacterium]MBU1687041.1 hypothetical protein [Pseudomonadota bacterium]
MKNTVPNFIEYLLTPAAYPHPATEIKLVQTHISYVVLAGDFVYKLKKPVDFGFLNFTTLDQRRHFCERELVLNRRLCPDLYLGMVTIAEEEGRLNLDGRGSVVEYGVKMRRMPEEKMMGRIIGSGGLTREMLDRIVAILVPFYGQAEATSEINSFGRPEAVGVNVRENFDQTEGFIGCSALSREQFEIINHYTLDFLAREGLFAVRMTEGRIRDCHGDLYSANICLTESVQIFDCIEFNERFRYCDIASDVAFLAMDLDFHGLPELSRYFIDSFVALSGDSGLLTMLDFYKCYRAYVRGKIGLFTAHAPEVDEETRQGCLDQASRYFALAEGYAVIG